MPVGSSSSATAGWIWSWSARIGGLVGGDELWDLVLPSVVAGDPKFMGDEEAFCDVYAKGEYAPDLVEWEGGL